MASEEPKKVRKRKITVRSSDGVEFVMKEAVAMQSVTIRCMIEDECVENGVPLHNVDSKTLAKVIKYCKRRAKSKSKETDKTWEAKFMKKVNNDMLFDLMQAANYLDVKGLLDLTCQTVADLCKGKMPEEIRKIFDIENDFTPEEEEEIRRENIWAFI